MCINQMTFISPWKFIERTLGYLHAMMYLLKQGDLIMKVLIICASGMSTSLIKSRMNRYASENGLDIRVDSDSYDNLSYVIQEYDIILFAPQVAMHFEESRREYTGSGKIFCLLTVREFGSMDGQKLIQKCRDLYDEKYRNGKLNLENELLEIISSASEAQRLAYEAFDWLEKKKYSRARQCIKEGRKAILPAHQIQSQLIAMEMEPENADKIRVSLLMVHAQNHLMSAIQTLDLTERMIALYMKKD